MKRRCRYIAKNKNSNRVNNFSKHHREHYYLIIHLLYLNRNMEDKFKWTDELHKAMLDARGSMSENIRHHEGGWVVQKVSEK